MLALADKFHLALAKTSSRRKDPEKIFSSWLKEGNRLLLKKQHIYLPLATFLAVVWPFEQNCKKEPFSSKTARDVTIGEKVWPDW